MYLPLEYAKFYSHSGFDFPGILRAVIKNAIQLKKVKGPGKCSRTDGTNALSVERKNLQQKKPKEALLTLFKSEC